MSLNYTKRITLNTIQTDSGEVARTILATYHKIGVYNVFEHDFPAILELCEDSTRGADMA